MRVNKKQIGILKIWANAIGNTNEFDYINELYNKLPHGDGEQREIALENISELMDKLYTKFTAIIKTDEAARNRLSLAMLSHANRELN